MTDSIPKKPRLPEDSAARKDAPIFLGAINYFPRALAMISRLSKIGNAKHNPDEPLHWAPEKSNDHADCIVRHLIDAFEEPVTTESGARVGIAIDPTSGLLHAAGVGWRGLAFLEEALKEAERRELARVIQAIHDGAVTPDKIARDIPAKAVRPAVYPPFKGFTGICFGDSNLVHDLEGRVIEIDENEVLDSKGRRCTVSLDESGDARIQDYDVILGCPFYEVYDRSLIGSYFESLYPDLDRLYRIVARLQAEAAASSAGA